jgi:hypothetical protein
MVVFGLGLCCGALVPLVINWTGHPKDKVSSGKIQYALIILGLSIAGFGAVSGM